MSAFVILDRDGTLIEEKNYLADPDGVELTEGAREAVEEFARLGFGVIVVSNQSGVGRGYFTMKEVMAVNARMLAELGEAARHIQAIYVCPHAPEANCDCRKPRTGLVERAARELGLEAAASCVIGDKPADVELARACGAAAILVTTGYGAASAAAAAPDYVAANLSEAAAWLARRR